MKIFGVRNDEVRKENPTLTMEQIGEAIGIGRTSVYKVVKSLKEIGVLEHKGRKRDGEWVIKTSSPIISF